MMGYDDGYDVGDYKSTGYMDWAINEADDARGAL